MKLAIPTFYAEYGRYINRFRAIPWHIDCLKPVERRLLLSLMTQAKKKTKSATVVGHCMGHYHPHGDMSLYESLVQLVHRGFAFGQGNWGSPGLKDEFKAASMRYTEVKNNEILTKLFQEFIKFADTENLELNPEPLYLPCPIPIGLIGHTLTTGISFYTTKLPQYAFADLCTRLKYLLEIRAGEVHNNEPIIAPNIMGCDVYEDNIHDFKNILTMGYGVIQIVPRTEIDTANNCIYVYGKVPTERGGFGKLIKAQDKIGIRVLDESSMKRGYKLIIEPPLGSRVNSQFEQDIAKLIASKITINCNVVYPNGSVKSQSIDSILLNNYDHWLNCYLKDRQQKIGGANEALYEIQVVEIVRNIIQSYPTVKLIQDIIDIYEKEPKFQKPNVGAESIRNVCSKYSIKKLIEHKFDAQQIQNKINALTNEINNINQHGYERVLQLLGV